MKRLFAGMTAALLAVILVFSFPAQGISAKNAILIDCTSGRVLQEKNSDQKSLIASTTKIMTALVICERCNVLDRMRIPNEAVGIEGSSIYLRKGEILTIQDLLYGLMLHSGNDAAVALAIYCAGTIEEFSQLMNDKARSLGMQNTHFENPHGLDTPNHYSTANDLAILTSYAMNNPIFEKIVSTKTVTVGNRTLKNHNKLLWLLKGADGVKTGYTKAAGRILVSSAKRDGRRLVAVTIDDPNDWQDHQALMESAFACYETQLIIDDGDVMGSIEIAGGEEGSVQLVAEQSFSYPLAENESVQISLPAPGFVYAPIAENQKAGSAQIYLDNKWIGSVALVYGQTVEQEEQKEPNIWQRFLRG